jgi:hypothetical protein
LIGCLVLAVLLPISSVLVGAAVVAVGALLLGQQRRSQELQDRFGPEYKRTVEDLGDKRRAESELAAREKRVDSLNIHPLTGDQRNRFSEAWHETQALFVDQPSVAITEANRLVNEVMQARGYPVGDWEQRVADISVNYPHVVENYRVARQIANKNKDNQASTEDLRQAMVRYRALFEELLMTGNTTHTVKEVVR